MRQKSTRRDFLKRSAAVAGTAAATPYVLSSARTVKGQDANEKPTIAAIGIGGSRGRYSRGGGIARQAGSRGEMIAVCDCDILHMEEFNAYCQEKYGHPVKQYKDYRDLFDKEKPDMVTIGTPDHWHVPIAIAAMKAGCDVYCEKPLTLTIDEGKQICKVVEETGKIFQVGTQQRTENGRKFLQAIAMVKLGMLGENVRADLAIGGAPSGGPFEPTPVPDKLDWDLWLGPAPKQPYMEERRKIFRWFLEYSGGKMTDWGAHHIDIAQWALSEDLAPCEVGGTGTLPVEIKDPVAFFAGEEQLPHSYNAATNFNITLKYPNGSEMSVNHHYKSEDGNVDFGNGILFTGDEGRIFVNRGSLDGKPVEELTDEDKQKIEEKVIELYNGKTPGNHMQNFFDCVKDRTLPVSDVFSHHRTMTSCHLCNFTLLLGETLTYDPETETFPDNETANQLMSRPQREGYQTQG
jgi:predicted dehydrogenase